MLDDDNVLYAWEEQADRAHSALLMVDLQNDFVHPDGWVAQQRISGHEGDTGISAVVERSTALLEAARTAGIPRVFVRMIGDDRYLSGPMKAVYARNHGRELPTCVAEGTWGADWVDGLKPIPGDDRELVVDKHRNSAFIGTRLDLLLRSRGVRTIVVCGVATSGCVESTIRDGYMLDYYVVTAGDACGDYEPARHHASLSKIQLSLGTVVDVDDVHKAWA
jgi:ureidoacrylate peracid hydrolase